MSYPRLIFTCLTLVVALGVAGAITHGIRFMNTAPAAASEAPRAKGPAYNGKSLQRAINVLQGAAGLVGRSRDEPATQEPAAPRKPATREVRPEADRVPDEATNPAPAPAPAPPPTVRQDRPERGQAPAPRTNEPSDRPVIV
jgi:hypothetical protein